MTPPTFSALLTVAIQDRGIDATNPRVAEWRAAYEPGAEYVIASRGIAATKVKARVAGHLADALRAHLANGARVIGGAL